MSERREFGSRFPRLRALAAGAGGGYIFGLISYGGAHLLTDEAHARSWGMGIGGGFLSLGGGAMLAGISLGEAQDHLEAGRRFRANLKLTQAIAEGALGGAITGGIIGLDSGGPDGALKGAGIGAGFTALSTFLQYRSRLRKIPELVFPEGTTVERDERFPNRIDGREYPPVYQAGSLEDVKQFRAANKERLTAKVFELGPISARADEPSALREIRFTSAVFILPDVQHYPILNPENRERSVGPVTLVSENQSMRLHDSTSNIVAQPSRHSFWFWLKPTIFDIGTQANPIFDPERWGYWQDRSWKHQVVILAQYQGGSTIDKIRAKKLSQNDIVDNYWLLHIHSDQGGRRKRVKEPGLQGQTSPAFGIQPSI